MMTTITRKNESYMKKWVKMSWSEWNEELLELKVTAAADAAAAVLRVKSRSTTDCRIQL